MLASSLAAVLAPSTGCWLRVVISSLLPPCYSPPACCSNSYDDLVAAGFSVAELHLEDRSEGGSSGSDSDSDCEFANSDDWDTGIAAPAAVQAVASTSFSSSGSRDADRQQASSSSCSTPTQQAGIQEQPQQAGSRDDASDATDTGSGIATVVLRTSDERGPRSAAAGAGDAVSLPDNGSRAKQQHAATAISSRGDRKDPASAGSVTGAALQVAARTGPAPRSLSVYKLTAEANRNLTGQEKKEKGGLSFLVLRSYIQAAGGFLIALGVLGVMATEQGSRVLTDTFLGWWASDLFKQGLWFYIGIYAGLGVLYSLLTFVR